VFLDVGAHVGHWSLRLAERAGRVIAVEANPATAATLRRHIAMNGLPNVTVVELAAWDEQTMLALDDPNGQIEGGSMRVIPAGKTTPGRLVPAGRLDEQLELTSLDRLDLIKLDVEGADIHALRGMKGLLDKFAPVLFIECHDIYGYYTREDLEQTLTELGYGFEVAASVPSQWTPTGYSETVQQGDYLVAAPVT
jgi:FkbM family methyltransferase